MRKIIGCVVAGTLLCVASPAFAKKQPELTPMQLQAIQQKEFETEKPTVFAAVMSVLQDLGYTIDSAEMVTGFITASSATTNKTNFFEAMAGVSGSGNTRVTAFCEARPGNRSRVRLNFVSTKSRSGMYGQSARQDQPILDPTVYQRAFERIDEAVFVNTATDSATTPKDQPAQPTATKTDSPAEQGTATAPTSPATVTNTNPATPQPQ
jgi:hypothetical protein